MAIHNKARTYLASTVGAVLCAFAAPVCAQATYPTRPVSIVVQTPPGGPLDAAMRVVAKQLEQRFGGNASVIVENRPGANGLIATKFVAQSPPDGHTLLGVSVSHVANPSIHRNMPFDPLRELKGIAHLGVARNVFVASSVAPPKSIEEFVAWAKENPDNVTFGSGGVGSGGHLMAALIAQSTGIRMTHVAYKGGTAMLPDLVAGRVLFSVDTLKNMAPVVEAGSVRILGVTNAQRWPDLASVPTFVESGYPQVALNSWIGIVAPARTPPEVMARLERELAAIASLPEVREQFSGFGLSILPEPLVGEQFQAFMESEKAMWKKIADAADIKVD